MSLEKPPIVSTSTCSFHCIKNKAFFQVVANLWTRHRVPHVPLWYGSSIMMMMSMRRLRHLTHCGQNESQNFQLLDCALCCMLCSWHKEILGSILLLLPKAHVHRNVPKCLATSKKLAKNSNPMSAEDETDSMSTPSWKMRGGQCRCCPKFLDNGE